MNIEKLSKNETDIFLNTYRDNVIKFLDDIDYGESIKVLIKDWNHAFHAQVHPTTYISNTWANDMRQNREAIQHVLC